MAEEEREPEPEELSAPTDRLEGIEATFWRCVTTLTWLLVLALTIVSIFFVIFQLVVLYLPYGFAKLRKDESYKFPDYVYRVWGQDTTDLDAEHYGYLFAIVVAHAVLRVRASAASIR